MNQIKYHAIVATEYEHIIDNSGEDYWIIFLIEEGATREQIKEKYLEAYKRKYKMEGTEGGNLADYILIDPKIAPRLVRRDWIISGDSEEYAYRSQVIFDFTNYEVDSSYTATIEEIKEFQIHYKYPLSFEIEDMINGIPQ